MKGIKDLSTILSNRMHLTRGTRAGIVVGTITLIMVLANDAVIFSAFAQGRSTLTISLSVVNTNINSNLNFDPSNFRISITGANPDPASVPGDITGRDVTVDTGVQYTVNDPVLVDGFNGSERVFGAIKSGNCNGPLLTATGFCHLVIDLQNPGSTQTGAISPPLPLPLGSSSPLTSGPTNSFTNTATTKLRSVESDTPFKVCRTQEVPTKESVVTTNTAAGTREITPETNNILLAPTSATYTILGSTSFSNLDNIDDKTPITIQLTADFDPNDINTLALASPPFVGNIFVGTPPLQISTTNYEIQKLDTSCDYVALSKPISPNPVGAHIAPLSPSQGGPLGLPIKHPARTAGNALIADIGGLLTNTCIKNQGVNLGGKCNFKEASSDLLITSENGKLIDPNLSPDEIIASIAINPPFRSCAGSLGFTPLNAQIANYDIVGNVNFAKEIQSGRISSGTHTLQVVITSDVILSPQDLAKIANNNNPFVKVTLIVDPASKHPTLIPFGIQELSTHCKDIAFTSSPQLN